MTGVQTCALPISSDLVTLRISKDTFLRMVNEFPDMALEIIRDLAHKLERTNEQLTLARQSVN